MKKLIITFTICITVMCVKAQQTQETKDFYIRLQTSNAIAHEAKQAKNYALAVSTIKEWLSNYDRSTSQVKNFGKNNLPGQYYNLACYVALNGQEDEAIGWLEKAVDLGYANYKNTLDDSDLDSLHGNKRFEAAVDKMREKGDYGYMLQKSGSYSSLNEGLPIFTYQSANTPELIALKKKFNLDSIAGNGDEISKFKKLLFWSHNIVRHDGNSSNPPSKNAVDLIEVCQQENRGVNCRMMSTILRDAYQAEGFNTRIVTCMPKDTADNDCHVITVVWSKTLNKWVWMDPTFNAYVSDDKGNLMNIEEVRNRLVNGGALVLNDDANWNNKQKQTKENYLGYYMSKNLYWLKCSTKSEWNIETYKKGKEPINYIDLYPGKFSTIHQSKKVTGTMVEYATNNPSYFWQAPPMKN